MKQGVISLSLPIQHINIKVEQARKAYPKQIRYEQPRRGMAYFIKEKDITNDG